jgi:acyl transferase domain-containing protein
MFENAGIRLEDVVGSDTAVFVGSFCKDWGEVTLRDPDATPMYQVRHDRFSYARYSSVF